MDISRIFSSIQTAVVSDSHHVPEDQLRSLSGHMKFPSLILSSNICWYASGKFWHTKWFFAHLHCFSYFENYFVDSVSTLIFCFGDKSPIQPCKSFENVNLCVWSKLSLQWFGYFCRLELFFSERFLSWWCFSSALFSFFSVSLQI